MNSRKRSLVALISISIVILLLPRLSGRALAQDLNHWPPELNKQASIPEIIDWLERTSFRQARVGVRTSSTPGSESVSPALSQDARPPDSLFWSEGFKLIRIDGCHLFLRNDDARLIAYSKLIRDSNPGRKLIAELYVPLNRLSVKKGRAPYRLPNDAKKSQLLGNWRTEFKNNRSREDVLITLFLPGQTDKLAVWEAETLTFTFEMKEVSEKFNAAFRQTINLCQRR